MVTRRFPQMSSGQMPCWTISRNYRRLFSVWSGEIRRIRVAGARSATEIKQNGFDEAFRREGIFIAIGQNRGIHRVDLAFAVNQRRAIECPVLHLHDELAAVMAALAGLNADAVILQHFAGLRS